MKFSLGNLALCVLLWINSTNGQQLICSAQDKEAFVSKVSETSNLLRPNFGETLVLIGKTFLKTPYVAKTLEVGKTESLVINLQGLDCTTYIENILAFGLMLKSGKKDFDSYIAFLEKLRYRAGKLDGYPSRLHYFTDWIADNGQKGLVKDVTAEVGGNEVFKKINFMSTHRNLYPFLKDNDENYDEIRQTEQRLNQQPICILAQDQIETNEHLLKTGDIIALTTSIKGLDITHTGMATRESDGRIHLLHASSSSGEVEVSELPLANYLKQIKHNTGIMVARPMP
ncbi:N-acetylmuramoyl-L-alanine amidase-like domain-containing protein [Spongiimicrobium sp. 3-5]|uniref:N-acetylmuramoyl-L-alanine amidase-like domain-containing protein n=1 Tax=Spongiimicrobium sp. 3-5 TaxID=3332596 RepID=UPI003980A7D3